MSIIQLQVGRVILLGTIGGGWVVIVDVLTGEAGRVSVDDLIRKVKE